ncbi:CDT1-like protein a, chloroplastic [Humulus lupulus]|uniref:CDT1-like protein a, chloroplastic n=1 Tax=Humulus lupulus TaxID=3486 RepID=UPI002B4021FD|nr:CDT1-like protein a, chloroplastic [Humulus lupulus]
MMSSSEPSSFIPSEKPLNPNLNHLNTFDTSTPEKSPEISSGRRKDKTKVNADVPDLPKSCGTLGEFFSILYNSILLRRKGPATNFTNIRPIIERLTNNRFTYSYLAQLKFILPEVIEIKKTRIFNEKTSCMEPDLHIALNLDALDSRKLKSEGWNSYLRRVIQSRLADFSRSHPEVLEVPKGMLPEPFSVQGQGDNSGFIKVPPSSSCEAVSDVQYVDQESEEPKIQQSAVHFPPTFQRRLSQRQRSKEVDNNMTPKSFEPSVQSSGDLVAHSGPNTASSSKEVDFGVDFCPTNATPSEVLSTPATPALSQRKRSCMSPKDNSISDKLARRPSCAKSLQFDSLEKKNRDNGEVFDTNGVSTVKDLVDIPPEKLLKSISENEIKAKEERDSAIPLAKRRKETIASLPKLFNTIHFLFQSIDRSVIIKEDVMHKIISNHSNIVDRREVEEQLSLLLKLAPDWISEKFGVGGDLFLRIDKTRSPESIRSRLEAVN